MSPAQSDLGEILGSLGEAAVAVSGGVDSLTLAAFAGRRLGPGRALMVHAVSPAVPPQASARVRALAAQEGWSLQIVDAGEFGDPDYLRNPVNRCFFCKTNLYGVVAAVTGRTILSGANTDDLGDYRPGLEAARRYGVRHPYVEAGMDKAGVRILARELALGDIADLPASPCLSSRVETGIAIEAATLSFINAVEDLVAAALKPRTTRCRVRAGGVVIELDPQSLAALPVPVADALSREIKAISPAVLSGKPVRFAPYRMGAAFVGVPAGRAHG